MQPPPGYESQGESIKCLLKSLYSLKQAGRKWYLVLCRALADLGFSINAADPGIFYVYCDRDIIILAIHVDDCMITGSSIKLITHYKEHLNVKYSLTDLGEIHWLLGIKITCDRQACTILLSQTTYIESILNRFSLSDAKPYATPIVLGAVYSKSDAPSDATEVAYMAKVPYREAVVLPLFYFVLAHHAYYELAEHYDYRLANLFEHSLNLLITNYYTESPRSDLTIHLCLPISHWSSTNVPDSCALHRAPLIDGNTSTVFRTALDSCTAHRALLIDGNTSPVFRTLYCTLYCTRTPHSS